MSKIEQQATTPVEEKRHPFISKELFVDTINFMKNQGDRFMKLCSVAETLSPGEYVNFWPHLHYNTKILNILNAAFGFKDDNESMISYFCIDLEYGAKSSEANLVYEGQPLDISTPEKLYDFCVKTGTF